MIVACGYGLFLASFSYFKSEEIQKADARLSLYQNSLLSEIERFAYFPYVLSQDPHVIRATQGVGHHDLNNRLLEFSNKSGVEAIYLMDTTGRTIATSNFANKNSYLNQNYAFRPYFKQALAGLHGEFYGIGATTKTPGFFISAPVHGADQKVSGVIAIKLALGNLEKSWMDAGEQVLLTNDDSVVLLSSNPNWRYKALHELSQKRRDEIRDERQFADEPLDVLNWHTHGDNQATVGEKRFLLVKAKIATRNWHLYFFASERPVVERVWMTLISFAVIISLFFGFTQLRRSMRIGVALRASQADSAELREANTRLAVEIDERVAAERRLQRTQDELARASRLAALGQLAVSVTHELGQPIAAMRNYMTAAELSPNPPESSFLQKMTALVLRMENITKELKFFSSSGADNFAPIDVRDVIKGAEELLAPNFAASNVHYKRSWQDEALMVRGNQLRLEQVMTNLMRNALNAMDETENPSMSVQLSVEGENALIEVFDTGSGLGEATIEQLQEPFYSTQPSGKGMGLGLAISTEIVREHGGHINARNRREKGAVFSIHLPLGKEEE